MKRRLPGALVLALAAILRSSALDAGWFGVDQARDLAWGQRIASGQAWPVVGPAMRNRVHLGAGYYWFWALPGLVSEEPVVTYGFAAALGVAAVGLTGAIARRVGGAAAALGSALLLATSPVAVIDSRVAWAPAAVPPLVGAFLLVALAFLAHPSAWRAAALVALATTGTQLHLSTATLGIVAAGALLARWRQVGSRGVLLAALAGALPLLPMLATLGVAVADPPLRSAPAIPYTGRLLDLVDLVPRLVAGLSAAERPPLVEGWLLVERSAILLPAAAALLIACRWPVEDRSAARLVAATFLATVVVPALLPAELWAYYLDASLVPGAVVLGVALTERRWRRSGAIVLGALAAGRTALLAWWIGCAASAGLIATNLDLLRLGGPRPADPSSRARVLGLATKLRAAEVLTGPLAVPRERLWRDVHGPAFADLDTDNGYLLGRAARASSGGIETDGGAAIEPGVPRRPRAVAALYRGEIDSAWSSAMGPAHAAGPIDLRAYQPVLDERAATLEDCAGQALPARVPPDPLDYRAGEPHLPKWPCSEPTVVVPFAAPAAAEVVRVLPWVNGAGRVLSVESLPAGKPIHSTAPGLGDGVELGRSAGTLRIRLSIHGPAALDLVELHGAAGLASESPRGGQGSATRPEAVSVEPASSLPPPQRGRP